MAKKSVTAPSTPSDITDGWPHDTQLGLAASYIEQSMRQIRVCVAALRSQKADRTEFEDECLRSDVAELLGECGAYNDLDVAREIFAKWQSEEVRNG